MCRLEYCGQKNKKYSFEYFLFIRARDGTRTRGPDLGKVVLHQLSHSRIYEMFMYLFARHIWYLTMEKDNCQLFFANFFL